MYRKPRQDEDPYRNGGDSYRSDPYRSGGDYRNGGDYRSESYRSSDPYRGASEPYRAPSDSRMSSGGYRESYFDTYSRDRYSDRRDGDRDWRREREYDSRDKDWGRDAWGGDRERDWGRDREYDSRDRDRDRDYRDRDGGSRDSGSGSRDWDRGDRDKDWSSRDRDGASRDRDRDVRDRDRSGYRESQWDNREKDRDRGSDGDRYKRTRQDDSSSSASSAASSSSSFNNAPPSSSPFPSSASAPSSYPQNNTMQTPIPQQSMQQPIPISDPSFRFPPTPNQRSQSVLVEIDMNMPMLQALSQRVGGIKCWSSPLYPSRAWAILSPELDDAYGAHSGERPVWAFACAPRHVLFQFSRVGFSGNPLTSVPVDGGNITLLHQSPKCAVETARVNLYEPAYLLMCHVTAKKISQHTSKQFSDKSFDTKQWFTVPSTGLKIDAPDKCALHRANKDYAKAKNKLLANEENDTMLGVTHWSQIIPRYLIYLKRKRKEDLWHEVEKFNQGLVRNDSYIAFELPTSQDRASRTTLVVDPHPQSPPNPNSQFNFVTIWDSKPMFEIHVLAMPRHRLISPEECYNPAEIISALIEYVEKTIIPGFKKIPRFSNYNFSYGFHTDPSQDQMHCHVFSRDHRVTAPPAAFKKFTQGEKFFKTPQEEVKLIESFQPLKSHFTLFHDPINGRTSVYNENAQQ